MALALGWIVYDFLCRSPLADNEPLLALVGFGYVVATSWVFTLVFSGRGALIHTGALMATIMTANVFFIIMPNQRKSVAALHSRPEARSGMGQKLEDTLDAQQLHHPAGAVPDAVESHAVDLLQSARHSRHRHLHHRRGRDGALFLQRLASRSRPRALVGVGGRRGRHPLRLRRRRDRFARHALAHGAGGAADRDREPRSAEGAAGSRRHRADCAA